ncbi:MAG: molybdate ABC transporter substrate-binding protein [Magnetococcales bacterium]|nr:molybdate ABC transporter substrate-binding protein [Magnetococcales bacterium]
MRSAFLIAALLLAIPACADEVQVAVAANFTAPAKRIAEAFGQATGHKAVLAFGATGTFYAQIKNGAPFEVLLAADGETPARLESEGDGVSGSSFTYAVGRLVLWSSRAGMVGEGGEILRSNAFKHLSVANPKLAPYGAAAVETLTALGLLASVQSRFVQAENIAQAHQFVATGNAELGFVALSQVMQGGRITEGSGWIVPETLHRPIRQGAVLLVKGGDRPAARAWMEYLKGQVAREVITSFGYALEQTRP